MDTLDRIEQLFSTHGNVVLGGRRRQPVSTLQHALQCAQLAEWAQASDALVAAALLHDLGHHVDAEADDPSRDNGHEMRVLPLLATSFGASVTEPIRLHVQAKRYLVAAERGYLARLTPASVHALQLQGGPMSGDEMTLFEATPHADVAVELRRWDDLATQPRRRTPALAHYLDLLRQLAGGRTTRPLLAAA